jgi:hypothetical protein
LIILHNKYNAVVSLDLAHYTGVLVFANAKGYSIFQAFQKKVVLRLLERAPHG